MLLQYPVNLYLLNENGRLNPHDVELEEAGDCGANTLFLLGLIERLPAMELSRQQNICWINKKGIAFSLDYLLKTYLFTDPTKQYHYKECSKEKLMTEVQVLKGGYGTFLFMKDAETNLGHFTCIYKNEHTHEIEIADLQTEEIIRNNYYELDRLDNYLSQYDLFSIPFELDSSSPVRRHAYTVESYLRSPHGSPAKTIPSPVRHHEDSENVDSYRSPEKVRHQASESPLKIVRSPLTPLTPKSKKNRVGGKRKRKTRRKN